MFIPDMSVEVAHLPGPKRAETTPIGLLSCVDHVVMAELALVKEFEVANGTSARVVQGYRP